MTKKQLVEKIKIENTIHKISRKQNLFLVPNFNHKKEQPKPFVKWVGGKRQLLQQFRLLNLYPPKEFNQNNANYFEPFVGGGALFFDFLPHNAFLSDLNKWLVISYNVVKNDVENLIISLKKHQTDKDYFLQIRELNPESLSNLEIASRFIYLNRTCFNGMYRVNSKDKFNVPFGKYNNPLICDEANLRLVSQALQKSEIAHQDFKKTLEKAQKGDFIYFDPPYHPINQTSSFTAYDSAGFTKKDQMELRGLFLELHKKECFVMLSNSDTDFINDIYSNLEGIKITKIQANRAINSDASKRGKISELLITNY